MNHYKCEDHKIDLACLGCINAWIARHDRMLEFLKDVSSNFNNNLTEEEIYNIHLSYVNEAQELLKEIGR